MARSLPFDQVERAFTSLVVPSFELLPGRWRRAPLVTPKGHIGYLLIAGLITRELRVLGARSVELLGPGDLIRPGQEDSASFTSSGFFVVEPSRLVVIDAGCAARMAAWPQLVDELVDRGLRRARRLAAITAIGHMVGIERRLEALFWCLAERWGTLAPEGVTVSLPLTHQLLADLVGARRPSVTTALSRLSRAGTLTRSDGAWLLRGDPPPVDEPGESVCLST
jgi:CRP-like cAMP-binding protein